MADLTLALLAVLPLAVIGVLMVGLYQPATRTMPIAWVIAAVVAFVGWEMAPRLIAAASIRGALTATRILVIVFGAILLLYTLKQSGAFEVINAGFSSISDDRRVQVVLLCFLMGSFIEGAAGFGTPAAIVGPLLVGLGFPPLAAVVVALTGNLLAITFGAVGTPLIIGLRDVVFAEGTGTAQQVVQQGGFESVGAYVAQIGVWAAVIHAIVGIAVPFIGVAMMTRFFGEDRSIKPALEVLPLTLFAWAAFAVPYVATAVLLGPTFPALLGSMVGLLVVTTTLRAGYFLPDEEWDFGPRDQWPDHWVGSVKPGQGVGTGGGTSREGTVAADGGVATFEDTHSQDMSLGMAWLPYVLVAALLVLTRVVGPVQEFLSTTGVFAWNNILGTPFSEGVELLYLPGSLFVLVAVVTYALHGMNREEITDSWSEALRNIAPAVIALWFAVATVMIMQRTGSAVVLEAAPVDSGMLGLLSEITADTTGQLFPFFSGFIGAFGAFIAGSNTVSDILFGLFQFQAAQQIGAPTQVVVAAQAVGGAFGNLISIHNVVAALTVVGLIGEEGRVIRLELIPVLYYGVFTGIVTLLLAYVVAPGAF
ncbi:L-lactate permease [Haloarcula halophila]|uniref:L-lactate permease n=1 Tax=Haloarcula TaxID=2237 RepID=UPI0023E39154|nr:L-lactate permease [Halomicroarcula sp. DFY41]